jgi:hypothetical protein
LKLAAGRADVEKSLSEMPPEQFDEYVAMDRISPFGNEGIYWVLATGFAALMDRIAEASGDKNTKPVRPKAFIPWLKKKKPKLKYVSPNAAAAAFKMAVNR